MPQPFLITIRCGLLAALAGMLGACASAPDGAGEALARASQAMGSVKTLRYVGERTGYTLGQAFRPDSAWPGITLHSVTRTLDYDGASMRDEVVLSRAEPRGGGECDVKTERGRQLHAGFHAARAFCRDGADQQ
jgi:hypothetical protein